MARDTSDLLHGTLDLLVLKALAIQPLHGFGLTKWIEQRTRDTLEWGVSENNRKAKYYSLTSKGRQQLRAETATWKRYVSAISNVLEST